MPGYVAGLKRKVMKELATNSNAITPMLFPYEPEHFWQSIRQIIREEVSSVEKQKPVPPSFETAGLTYNPLYKIAEVTDRRHIHLHVVANMVDNNGKAISDSFVRLRGKKTAQQLTEQYHLVPALSKNLKLTNYEALSKSEANKYKVYETILKTLPQCKNIQELENKLQLQGIETQYKYKGHTQEKQGVSFKIEEDCFKGSQVDRQFSLGNLEKILALNQKQSGELKQKHQENSPNYSLNRLKQSEETSSQFKENLQENAISKGIEKSLNILLSPEENIEQTPKELLDENKRRKKKRSQRLRH